MKYLVTRKNGLLAILVVFLLVLFPNPSVFADDNVLFCTENPEKCGDDKAPVVEPTSDSTTSTAGLSVWDYLRTGFSLVVVIGLLIFLLKFINRKNRLYDKSRFMKNVGGISLGQQKSVQLVVVGERYYLLGVGDDITLLKEITDRAEIHALTEYYEEVDGNSTLGWMDRILAWISEIKKRNGTEPNDKTTDFKNIFNTRLEEMKEERKRHVSRLTEKERNQDE